jgi:hypothetical protein
MWEGTTLREPQYVVGDRVQYSPDFIQDRLSGTGLYEIVCSMPIEANGHSYRIKSKTDGHERVAREHQLEKLPSTQAPERTQVGGLVNTTATSIGWPLT